MGEEMENILCDRVLRYSTRFSIPDPFILMVFPKAALVPCIAIVTVDVTTTSRASHPSVFVHPPIHETQLVRL